MKNREVVYIVQGYELKLENGGLTDVVAIEVYATKEKEAIEKASKYVKKAHYRVSNVIEK